MDTVRCRVKEGSSLYLDRNRTAHGGEWIDLPEVDFRHPTVRQHVESEDEANAREAAPAVPPPVASPAAAEFDMLRRAAAAQREAKQASREAVERKLASETLGLDKPTETPSVPEPRGKKKQ